MGYSDPQEVLKLDLNTDLWVAIEDRKKFQAIIEEQGFVRDYEARFKGKNGRTIWVRLSSHVWRDEQGNIRGYRGFVVDRTHEKLMCEQLAATETKYKELFDNIRDGLFITDEKGIVIDCNKALCDIIGYSREEFLGINYYKDLFINPDDVIDFRKKFTREGEIS